ncbi:sensor domain-containing diguanylate cyclase [Gilvimarinus agarilyticus]|uniref:sensor domain-containing diguanylate cyclase n=1 Tax=Gilvimarinus agarilyticus TaxID=679259 RepID=UPI000698842A|nr:diguanylate cyclase [Gilvimarinus agarilyticus]
MHRVAFDRWFAKGLLLLALSLFSGLLGAQPVPLSALQGQDVYSVFPSQPMRYSANANLDNPASYSPSPPAAPGYFGGAYKIEFTAINDLASDTIVLEPGGSIVERVLLQFGQKPLSGAPAPVLLRQGELFPNAYPFSYGFYLHWPQGEVRHVSIIVQSDYIYAPMRLWVNSQARFESLSRQELAVQWLCLGAGIALSIYNLIIYFASRRPMHLYYALFAISWVFGWAQVLQVPKELLGWQWPGLHWVGFLLLPLTSALFFSDFLSLKHYLPKLYKLAIYNGTVSALLIPVAIKVPGAGVLFASVFTGLMMVLAITAGVIRLRAGYKPACYFLLAYLMLLLPNLMSNLVNLGLLPPPAFNLYLFGLMGTALDALLLAFAMAYTLQLINQENIRLKNNLGEVVSARTEALELAQHELQKSNAQLRAMAYTDPLTGLMNRRYFEERLAQETERSSRYKDNFCLLLIDLDYFKKINDQFGHKVGDECLVKVAGLLRGHVRTLDVVSRLGGEEFCVLMPGADRQNAIQLAERIRITLANTHFPGCDGLSLTCSIGISSSASFAKDTDLIDKADKALYQAKAHGRNKVIFA